MFCKNLSIGTKIAVVFAVIAALNVIFDLFLASKQRGMLDRVLNFTDSTLLAQGLKDQAWDEPFRSNGCYTEPGRNVERINDSSNEVATGADHTARACLELSQLAASLRQTIGRFRLARWWTAGRVPTKTGPLGPVCYVTARMPVWLRRRGRFLCLSWRSAQSCNRPGLPRRR